MAKVALNQVGFSGGEASPLVLGRTDLDRYNQSVRAALNMVPVVQGPMTRRAGTLFHSYVKTEADRGILVPFVVGRTQSWCLEFGNLFVRVHDTAGYTGIEFASPYTLAQLALVDWTQNDSTMYLFHPDVPPQRIDRLESGTWVMSAVAFTTVPFAEVGIQPAATLTLSAATVGTGRTVTASAGVFVPSDQGRGILFDSGIAVITAYTSATQVTATINRAFASVNVPSGWTLEGSPQTSLTPSAKDPVGATITLDLGGPGGWRAGDVGAYVRVNGGLCKITGFTSTSLVNAVIVRELSAITASPALAWSLEHPVWTAALGYPRTGSVFQQRLVAAGTKRFPRTVWASRTGEPLDFELGTNDSDALGFTIDSDEATPITYVSATPDLVVLTESAEYSVRTGVEKPLTPSNRRVKPESNHGTAQVRPVLVGAELLFVQRAGRKVRAYGYRYDFDAFRSPDVTEWAEHLTKGGVTWLAYQQEPASIVWAVRADGALLSCLFNREQNPSVIGWNRHQTNGVVECIAVTPGTGRDQLWLQVLRTINGVPRRMIERMDETIQPLNPIDPLPAGFDEAPTYGCTVDCGRVISVDGGATTYSLPHLAGALVDIVADGAVLPAQTVPVSGTLELPRSCKRLMVGLHFDSWMELNTPEFGTNEGTAQGAAMLPGQMAVAVVDSVGGEVQRGTTWETAAKFASRQFGEGILNQPPRPYSGFHYCTVSGWEKGRIRVRIAQTQPLPLTVRNVVIMPTANQK